MNFDKVDPQEIIDKLENLIKYLEKRKQVLKNNDEKEFTTPYLD